MRAVALALLVGLAAGCAGKLDVTAPPPKMARTGEVAPVASGPAIDLVELPPVEKRIEVPGFAGATAWINVDHPLTMGDLKGRVVVVDFWTSCCINCLQTLPTLQAVEARFKGQPFTVVGVHSPKFEEEKGADRLRDIVADNRIEHPIAVDGDMKVWHAWGVDGWPTIAVLDVEGRVIWAASGEPNRAELESVVASAIDEGRKQNALAKGELKGLKLDKDAGLPLKYPGKVLALADGGLAIADTGHDRLVVVDKSGKVEATIGSGLEGKLDGSFEQASFKRPEGMTEYDGAIYLADTGNHEIRKIDRKARVVSTVAGTGEIGVRRLEDEEKKGTDVALRSPWDVLAIGKTIYVALAGSHQIGELDPARGTIRLFAGNGQENRGDGSLESAMFAQPSALATDGKRLFVLDSETSSVRAIDLQKREVTTVVGKALFTFGDVDGDRENARLQHPIGLAYDGGALWVADTYNSKVKRVDPVTGTVKTLAGGGDRTELSEPAGIAARNGVLFVADTDHHRVVRLPIDKPKVEAIALDGLRPPSSGVAIASVRAPAVDARDPVVALGTVAIGSTKAKVDVKWSVPAGTGINEAAPFRVVWTSASGLAKTPDPIRSTGAAVKDGFSIEVEPATNATNAQLTGVLDMVVCDVATHAVCVPLRRTVTASFAIAKANPASGTATIALPPAR